MDGRNQEQVTCLPLSMPRANRDQYIFWDALHPTQAGNAVFARRVLTAPTPSDGNPVNLQQMALM
ncbi:hypothetical protein AAC387_Pa04g1040 [Persea americana]